MLLCLIVDDSSTIRRITREILEDLGFRCAEVENGQEALDVCNVLMPDIIILDWNMPVMTGIEFLRALRAAENGSIPKVLFCTTENSPAFILDGLMAGADEYIMKPFDKDIMASKLMQIGFLEEACV